MSEGIIFWSPGVTLENIEKQVILKAYRFYERNKTATANALGIAIRTLDNKLDQYKKEDQEQEARNEKLEKDENEFQIRQRGGDGYGQENINAGSRPNVEPAKENKPQTHVSMRK